jgi:D-methionine transport system substrate-binding protein
MLLRDAGLLTLKADFDPEGDNANFSEIIIENKKNLIFKENKPAADYLVPAYKNNEADLFIINSNFALEGNLNPLEDTIFIEKATDNPYVNIIATRAELLDSPKIKALIAVLKETAIKEFINEKYQGSVINAS